MTIGGLAQLFPSVKLPRSFATGSNPRHQQNLNRQRTKP